MTNISSRQLLWSIPAESCDEADTGSGVGLFEELKSSQEKKPASHKDLDRRVFQQKFWLDQSHMDYALQKLLVGGEECYSWEMRATTWLPVAFGKDIGSCSTELGASELRGASPTSWDERKPIIDIASDSFDTNSSYAGPVNAAECSGTKPEVCVEGAIERTIRDRRALNTAFRNSHANNACLGPDCVAPFVCHEGSHIVTCIFKEPDHWVGVAMCNLEWGMTESAKRGGRPSIVVMDALFRGENNGRPPEYHADVAQCAKVFLANVLSFSKPCTACETEFGTKGMVKNLCDTKFQMEGIEVISPRVPEQVDGNQCGPMSVLSIWAFLKNADFAKHCMRTSEVLECSKPCSGIVYPCPYTHEDALSLREYMRVHWELDHLLPNAAQ